MRITNGMLITNMMRNYNKHEDLAKLQEHLASERKFSGHPMILWLYQITEAQS